MKILVILFMFVVAFLFSLIHDNLIGQIGCWIIGGWGVLCVILYYYQRHEMYNKRLYKSLGGLNMDVNGKLKFHKIEMQQKEHALYYDIFFIDKVGNVFKAHDSHFLFDLEYAPNQLLDSDGKKQPQVS